MAPIGPFAASRDGAVQVRVPPNNGMQATGKKPPAPDAGRYRAKISLAHLAG